MTEITIVGGKTPNATFLPEDQPTDNLSRLPLYLLEPKGNDHKKIYQFKTPTLFKENRLVAAEIYTTLPLPSKGRIIGLDFHPDT